MATYQAQPTDVVLPGAQSATELLTTVGGFVAGCGFAALDTVLHVVRGESIDAQHVTAIVQQAVTEHQTMGAKAGSGEANSANVKYLASQHGVTLSDVDFNKALDDAGTVPSEIGVSNATVFGGNDARVFGHYVSPVGKTASGSIITADPNSNESLSGGFVVYSRAQFAAAQPFWAGEATGTGGNPLTLGAPATNTLGANFDIPNPFQPIGDAGTAISQAIGNFLAGLLAGATLALKRAGVFIIGALLLVLGVVIAFHGGGIVKAALNKVA
jgi:hypothetical protein